MGAATGTYYRGLLFIPRRRTFDCQDMILVSRRAVYTKRGGCLGGGELANAGQRPLGERDAAVLMGPRIV